MKSHSDESVLKRCIFIVIRDRPLVALRIGSGFFPIGFHGTLHGRARGPKMPERYLRASFNSSLSKILNTSRRGRLRRREMCIAIRGEYETEKNDSLR